MDELISRDAVIDALSEYVSLEEYEDKSHTFTVKPLIKRIVKLPSITQKSGKWVDRQFRSKIDGEIRNGWECSECGERFFRYDLINTDEFIPKFCPNCGAKMVESQESEDKE